MSFIPSTHIIQVTNVAPAATLEQMRELFGFLGDIKDIKLYPTENYVLDAQSKVCYVQYREKWSVGVAQHLTNTVFIDRALIVVPIADDGIPSEATALSLISSNSSGSGFGLSGFNSLINEISGVNGALVLTTIDPKLTALGLPQYPPLSANLDPVKIEEIRRTVTVGNLDPAIPAEKLLKFMNQIGEVKFLRMAGESLLSKCAFVEFTDQSSVPKALQCNGVIYEGRPLIINHSTSAIVKPLPASSDTGQREINEAMKRVQEAESLITAVVEPELSDKEKRRQKESCSRSRSRHRSNSCSRHKRRSRSRSERSRSKQRSCSQRRSKTPSRHYRHKSRSRSRSRSREKRKHKTSSRHKKKKSRSRSRDKSKKHEYKSHSPSKSELKSKSEERKESKDNELNRSRNKENSSKKDESKKKEPPNEASKTISEVEKSHRSPSKIFEKNSSYLKEGSKSPARSVKGGSPWSHSKSHVSSDHGTKSKRKKSYSPAKESFSSHRNKYQSANKHRSRSEIHKRSRSRSRSKKSERKARSPYSPRKSRNRSQSRDSFSHRRRSNSRRRKLSKDHSESSEKKSVTSKQKCKAPRKHSPNLKHESRNSKCRSRSQSQQRLCSPLKLRMPSTRHSTSPSSRKHLSSPSPRKRSSSPSPSESRSDYRKEKESENTKEPGLSPIFDDDDDDDDKDDDIKHSKILQNFEEKGYSFLDKLPQHTGNDCILYAPEEIGYNYNSGSNSADMDLASD